MKKFVSIALVFALLLSTASAPLVKSGNSLIVVKLWVGSPYMEVNGLRQPIDAEGTKPVIIESRTLVPIRAIIETFGGTVGWSLTDKKVTISFNGNILELTINKPTAYLNGFEMPIDPNNNKVVPQIIGGRTMVPLRFVAESFGIGVDYDSKTKQITLTYTIVTPPNAPMLISPSNGAVISPSNGAVITDTKITFSWISVSDADYYKIVINSNGINVYSQDKISSTSITIPQSALGAGTFTWQVAAHNSAGYSQFSTSYTFTVTVQTTLLQPPTLISPISNTVLNNSNITFNWTSVSGADSYKLQITKDNIGIYSLDTISTNSFTLSGIELQSGNYLWQVAAHNAAGWSDWSLPGSFILQKQLTTGDIAKFVDRVVYIEAKTADGTNIGTGFIISSDGKIVTNYHVIDKATSGTVTLSNNTTYDIDYVLGYSKPTNFGDKDLAVIKINATNLPVCTLGDSDRVQVGDKVVTIGNPLGIQNVVSEGIVSKVWTNNESLPAGLIQITAPISPGNSGGPLFNMSGEVIGVNTFYSTEGQNLNFALPINWLKQIDTSLYMTLAQVYLKEYGSLPTQLSASVLVSPDDGESFIPSVNGYNISFNWLPVNGAIYYVIWIGEGLSGAESTNIYKKQTTSTTFSIATSTLPSGEIYTWAIGAVDASGKIVWSEDRHFSIAKEKAINLISPYNGEHTAIPMLSWSSYIGADSYYVAVVDVNSQIVYTHITIITMDVVSVSNLKFYNVYGWCIFALKDGYIIATSEFSYFYYGF